MLFRLVDAVLSLGLAVVAGLVTYILQRQFSNHPRFGRALAVAVVFLVAGYVALGVARDRGLDQPATGPQPSSPPTSSVSQSSPPTTVPPAASETSAAPVEPPATEPDGTEDTGEPTPILSPTPPAPKPIPTAVDAMAVKTDRPDNAWGFQVGPNLIQMGGNGATIAVAWEARSGGVAVGGDNCQILASISGPEDQAAERSAKCSGGRDMTKVRSSPVGWTVRTAG